MKKGRADLSIDPSIKETQLHKNEIYFTEKIIEMKKWIIKVKISPANLSQHDNILKT